MEKRRVVVTGMGVVAPNGIGIEDFWDSLVHGRSGVRRINHFDVSTYTCQIAGIVPDFNPADYMDFKIAKRLSRFAQFALAASQMAAEDSFIDFSREDPNRMGVFVGTAIGGGDVIETQHNIFIEKGAKRIAPFAVVSISTHSASGAISCEFNLKGPNTTISSGCNTGLDATYLAYNEIRLGDSDVMIVGAGESPVTPYIQALFSATGFLSRENQEPWKAVKPYDLNADGIVLGEGGACIILEELQHALERGARIYGEILSYSSLNEAYDLVEVSPDSTSAVLNFEQVLKRGNIDKREVDYINAHGNGLPAYDIIETKAIKEVFGELAYNIPVTSIKPLTGQSMSAVGICQIIASLLAMKHSIVPPTINLKNPAPECDLNYVADGFIRRRVETALINAHGFGGRLTALMIRKFPSDKLVFRDEGL
jgi:3-oxoacyl-[acyl-carrier-protein] synthase II